MKNPSSDAWNNHRYWAGLAVCAAGITRNDTREFHFGMDALNAGVDEIGPTGALPRELERAAMALHYHLYALAPLIMLAELAKLTASTATLRTTTQSIGSSISASKACCIPKSS